MNTWAGDTPNCGGTYRDHWEKNGIPVYICRVQIYTHTHSYTHSSPPPTSLHTCNTRRPDTHILVGVMKPDGQVVLLHWIHEEGRHQPVGDPINEPIQESEILQESVLFTDTNTHPHEHTSTPTLTLASNTFPIFIPNWHTHVGYVHCKQKWLKRGQKLTYFILLALHQVGSKECKEDINEMHYHSCTTACLKDFNNLLRLCTISLS